VLCHIANFVKLVEDSVMLRFGNANPFIADSNLNVWDLPIAKVAGAINAAGSELLRLARGMD
jgi:hypothetical protein